MKNDRRVNYQLAMVVTLGIYLDRKAGTVRAWTFMAEHDVSQEVIMRVLRDKHQHRVTDEVALGIIRQFDIVMPRPETAVLPFGDAALEVPRF